MSYSDFVELALAMRLAQKHYFRVRDNLEQCKRLERALDDAIEEWQRGPVLFVPDPPAPRYPS